MRGTIHWVSTKHAINAEIRLYDRLFKFPEPASQKGEVGFKDALNPDSLIILTSALLEPSLVNAKKGDHFQFERVGYFYVDHIDSAEGAPVFNRTVSLRDTWAKIEKSLQSGNKP